jgi:lysophospholipase L1-like esterase
MPTRICAMKSRGWRRAVACSLGLMTAWGLAHAGPPDPAHAGIVADPCAHLPPPPKVLTDSWAAADVARKAGREPAAAPADVVAAYESWSRTRNAMDFAGLCRYREANATLPAPTAKRVVFIGDSITEGWSNRRPAFFAGDRINRGIGGQTTPQMLARFRADVIDLEPAVVHILAGINDIAGNTGPTTLENIENNLRSMVELAQAHDIHVVLGAVLPASRFPWRPEIDPVPSVLALNDWLERYADEVGAEFVDYFDALDDGRHGLAPEHADDGVHPTEAGYAIMEPLTNAAIVSALD